MESTEELPTILLQFYLMRNRAKYREFGSQPVQAARESDRGQIQITATVNPRYVCTKADNLQFYS